MIRYFKRLFSNLLSVIFLMVISVCEIIALGLLFLIYIIKSFIDLSIFDKIENYILKALIYPLSLLDKLIYQDEIETCERLNRAGEDIKETIQEAFDCNI